MRRESIGNKQFNVSLFATGAQIVAKSGLGVRFTAGKRVSMHHRLFAAHRKSCRLHSLRFICWALEVTVCLFGYTFLNSFVFNHFVLKLHYRSLSNRCFYMALANILSLWIRKPIKITNKCFGSK